MTGYNATDGGALLVLGCPEVPVQMAIALYIAFSLVLGNASGRVLLPIGGPIFKATPSPAPAAPVSAPRSADSSADHTARLPALAA